MKERIPAKERSVPLWAFRLMAEREPDDTCGVIPTFYVRLLVEDLEREAKWARERETDLPARLVGEERFGERTRRQAMTDAYEWAAKRGPSELRGCTQRYSASSRGAEAGVNTFVLDHLHLVRAVARELRLDLTPCPTASVDRDDYLTAGAEALVRAGGTWRPDAGSPFVAYAWAAIGWAMRAEQSRMRWRRQGERRPDRPAGSAHHWTTQRPVTRSG